MMYRDYQNNRNDKNIENKKLNMGFRKILEFLKNNKILLALGGVILIGLIIIVAWPENKEEKPIVENTGYVLTLFGDLEIIIQEGEEYQEPGFYAYYNNEVVTNQVVVSGSVDSKTAGTYKITYQIGDKTLERKVVVREKEIVEPDNPTDNPSNPPQDKPSVEKPSEEIVIFKLIGANEIELNLKTPYQELGFIAQTADGKNLSDYVMVNNQVNIKKEGTYYITYTLNYNQQKYQLLRKVVVKIPLSIAITNNTSSYSKDKTLIVSVLGTDYSYLKLPDQTTKKDKMLSYKVTTNGTYTFYAYDTKGNYVTKSITVSTIDNTIDSASCTLNVGIKHSNIVVNATDTKSGISYYRYNGTNYLVSKIDIASRVKTASVVVYDKAGNYKSVNCQVNIQDEIYGFILIGDSRFVGMETYLGDDKRKQDTFVAKGAMGWDWFKSTAIAKVNNILAKNPDRKYYILCNLGINDYKYHLDDANYAKKLSTLAKTDWKDHIVGYISVNPFASVKDSRNKMVEEFNARQKGDIDGIYYCDTYNGIGLSNFEPRKSSDTTHYNKKTSLEIYDYIINNCAF